MAQRIGLAILRVRYRLTQAEAAKKLGVSIATYNLIEKGERKGSLEFWNNVQDEFGLTGEQIWNLQNGKDI